MTNEWPRHGVVLLAAGSSSRLGQPKQLIEIDGEPMLRRAARALLATAPLDSVVVLGRDAGRIASVIDDLPLRRITVDTAAKGMSASLRAGIAALDARCAAALVALTDQPAIDATHLNALRDAWQAQPMHAVASAYGGVFGVPAVLPRNWFEDIAKLTGDVGARELLRRRTEDVVAIAATTLGIDIDVPADLAGHRPLDTSRSR